MPFRQCQWAWSFTPGRLGVTCLLLSHPPIWKSSLLELNKDRRHHRGHTVSRATFALTFSWPLMSRRPNITQCLVCVHTMSCTTGLLSCVNSRSPSPAAAKPGPQRPTGVTGKAGVSGRPFASLKKGSGGSRPKSETVMTSEERSSHRG